MDFTKLATALRKREYEVSCFETGADAANYLDAQIDGVTVGFGDSMTLKDLGIYELLSKHNTVYDPAHPRDGMDFYTTAPLCLTTDVFLTSVNGIAETGEMVNIDGTGNRVALSLQTSLIFSENFRLSVRTKYISRFARVKYSSTLTLLHCGSIKTVFPFCCSTTKAWPYLSSFHTATMVALELSPYSFIFASTFFLQFMPELLVY